MAKQCICLSCHHEGKPKEKSKSFDYMLAIVGCVVMPPLGFIFLIYLMNKKAVLTCAACGSGKIAYKAVKASKFGVGVFIG